MKKKYQGVVVPTITPLTADFKLDHDATHKMFNNFRRYDVMPFILGTTGESPSIPTAVKQDFIKLSGKLKTAGDTYYAGIASNCLEESIDLAKYSFDHGIDVVAANLPSYYALTERQMLTYFEQLANAIPGPLIIYNIPATTHMSIPLSVIHLLSHHENIVGTKDSERSEERLNESLKLWADRADFVHFLGWAGQSANALLNGCDGLIPSTGNVHPQLYQQLYNAALNGDEETTFKLQKQSDDLGNIYQYGRTLGASLWALKVMMQDINLCEPNMMPPLTTFSDAEAEEIRRQMHAYLQQENIQLQKK